MAPMQALLDTLAALERPTDAVRVFHGRGGLHPGCEAWSLDAYPPVWLLTHFGPVDEAALQRVHDALHARWADIAPGEPLNLVLQQREPGEQGRVHNRVLAGGVPDDHVVTEDGARYAVHLLRGQNHGLFLDMAEGRRWVRRWAGQHPGGRVLNLFAYTCAFSVAALQGGATRVVNCDMASGALNIGRRNHALNGLAQGASFLPHDVFTSWGRLHREGPFELVVLDPPSHQKGSFVATKDYARLVRRLPTLLAPGGHALLCLNTPKLGFDFLHGLLAAEAPTLALQGTVPPPAAFADVDPARALKVVVVRAPDLPPAEVEAESASGPGITSA